MSAKWVVGLAVGLAGAALAQSGGPPERRMNVSLGPDTVFDRPVAAVVPALEGATATGENGRVGPELVFWGFEQASGRRVFLFACADDPDVDCAARVPAICPVATTVLESGQATGTVVRRRCRTVTATGPGDVRPGCEDRVEAVEVAVGLVSCG